MNSRKLCRIKTFTGLKDEIKETMDLKEYKKRILQSHVKSKFSENGKSRNKESFSKDNKKGERKE